ncbi:MAG: Gfo/Idh/MocA family oxidoreductase [Chthoniobacterales bacterium]
MTRKIRYGILGTSQHARAKLVPGLRKTTNSELSAIASRDGEKARRWAEELEIPRAHASYEALIADEAVDAIINPTPNSLHCEWTIKAAEAGKHILCEKPLAVSVSEVDRMIRAASHNGVLLMEAFKLRFLPQQARVRDWITSGRIGEVTQVRAELTHSVGNWEQDVRAEPEMGGGALWDAGCYCVNQIRNVFAAEPVGVSAFQRLHPEAGVDSTFCGMLQFDGDRVGYFVTGMEQPFRACCEILGTTGRIYMPNLFAGQRLHLFSEEKESTDEFDAIDPHAAEIEHFSECILSGAQPAISMVDSWRNTATLEALKKSAETRAVVVPAVRGE